MYPALPTVDVDISGTATLPDGRQVCVWVEGYVEGDTNAFVEESSRFEWLESGAELTLEEINSEVKGEDGQTHYLHEYVCDNAKWD